MLEQVFMMTQWAVLADSMASMMDACTVHAVQSGRSRCLAKCLPCWLGAEVSSNHASCTLFSGVEEQRFCTCGWQRNSSAGAFRACNVQNSECDIVALQRVPRQHSHHRIVQQIERSLIFREVGEEMALIVDVPAPPVFERNCRALDEVNELFFQVRIKKAGT